MISVDFNQWGARRVLVVGDVMLDRYSFGVVERISPEAPVPIVHKTHERWMFGGAANVARTLAAVGAPVTIAGIVGNDQYRTTFEALCQDQGIERCLLTHDEKPTTVKWRIMGDGAHQLLRLDIEDTSPLGDGTAERFFVQLEGSLTASTVVILSDYAKGCLTPYLVHRIVDAAHAQGKVVIGDCKPANQEHFRGVDIVCPNEKEARMIGGLPDAPLEVVGAKLVAEMQATVVVTRDAKGVSVFRREGGAPVHIPTIPVAARMVAGAGDVFVALLALGLANGVPLEQAAHIGTVGASIAIGKPETAVVTREELQNALTERIVSVP